MKFPDHPIEGDEVTDTETSGRTWYYDGSKWILKGAEVFDVNFDSETPIEVEKSYVLTGDETGKLATVTYAFDMTKLPRINPN